MRSIITSIKCRRTGSGSLSRISPSSSLAGFDGVFDEFSRVQIWRSGDVAGYAESFILGKHLGHVGVIPVLACRGRETWRSNFLVPLLLRLRGMVPFRERAFRRAALGAVCFR